MSARVLTCLEKEQPCQNIVAVKTCVDIYVSIVKCQREIPGLVLKLKHLAFPQIFPLPELIMYWY